MSPVGRTLCRLHGRLASDFVLSGAERPGPALRAVRFALDLVEMGEMFGWRGVVDVLRDRLGGRT